jgi:hypothetical protein
MRDIRNCYLYDGKAQVRKGLDPTATFVDDNSDPVTDILAIHPSRTEAAGIVVAYQATTGRVHVYRVDQAGTGPVLLYAENGDAFWFEVSPNDPPPTVILTDTYGKVFMAHSIRSAAVRGRTVYYDPLTLLLHTLMADLDGQGSAEVKFRGVARFHDYMVGWGFGSNTDQDRAEVLRHSLPGQPTEFRAGDYALVGQRNEPILNVIQTGQVAVVGKENDLWQWYGYSRETFGVRPLDSLFGFGGARLAGYFNGACLFWSLAAGPRLTDGQSPSVDLGARLDLDGFEPADLVRSCDITSGFIAIRPRRQSVEWVFGQLSYVLSMKQPEQPRWSYFQYAVPLNCYGLLYETEVAPPTALLGYPLCVASASWLTIRDEEFVARVEHVSPPAGGVLELWVRVHGDPWPALPTKSVAIQISKYQDVIVTGLTANTTYDLAWRHRLGTQYTLGYQDPDPDNWSPTAIANSVCDSAVTTTNNLRNWVSAVWSRTGVATEKVALTWTGGDLGDTSDLEKSVDQGANWTAVATVGAGIETYDYAPAGGEEETYVWFRVKATTGSTWSTTLIVWIGPQQPLGYSSNNSTSAYVGGPPKVWMFSLFDPTNPFVPLQALCTVEWVNGGASDTEVWYATQAAPTIFILADTVSNPLHETTFTVPNDEGWVDVKVRHKATAFGTDDFSDWSEIARRVPPPPGT